MKKWISVMLSVLMLFNSMGTPLAALAETLSENALIEAYEAPEQETAPEAAEEQAAPETPSAKEEEAPAPQAPSVEEEAATPDVSDEAEEETSAPDVSDEAEEAPTPDVSDEEEEAPAPELPDEEEQTDGLETPETPAEESDEETEVKQSVFAEGYALAGGTVYSRALPKDASKGALKRAELGTLDSGSLVYADGRTVVGDEASDEDWLHVAFAAKDGEDGVTVVEGYIRAGSAEPLSDEDVRALEKELDGDEDVKRISGHPLKAVSYAIKEEETQPDVEEGDAPVATLPALDGFGVVCALPAVDGEETGSDDVVTPVAPDGMMLFEFVCGLESHAHGEDCYDEEGNLVCELPEHTHTAECLEARNPFEDEDDQDAEEPELEPEYVCGLEAHTHDESCYDEEGNLICELPEHEHTDECLVAADEEELPDEEADDRIAVLICGEDHEHDESCYVYVGDLICDLDEHAHGEDCYDEEGNLVCELDEHAHGEGCYVTLYCGLDAHTHGEDCYDEEGNLVCELPEHVHTAACIATVADEDETPDEEVDDRIAVLICGEDHEHDESCYVYVGDLICDLDEHAHDESCYDEEGNLICGLEEHTHGEGCYVTLYCGLVAHTHDESCYDEEGNLVCELPEHVHTIDCLFDHRIATFERIITEVQFCNHAAGEAHTSRCAVVPVKKDGNDYFAFVCEFDHDHTDMHGNCYVQLKPECVSALLVSGDATHEGHGKDCFKMQSGTFPVKLNGLDKEGGSSDPQIEGVSVTHALLTSNGDFLLKPGDGGNVGVYEGTIYRYAFNIFADRQGHAEDNWGLSDELRNGQNVVYKYELPERMIAVFKDDAKPEGEITDKNGKVLATYKITGSGDGPYAIELKVTPEGARQSAMGFAIEMDVRFDWDEGDIELGDVTITVKKPSGDAKPTAVKNYAGGNDTTAERAAFRSRWPNYVTDPDLFEDDDVETLLYWSIRWGSADEVGASKAHFVDTIVPDSNGGVDSDAMVDEVNYDDHKFMAKDKDRGIAVVAVEDDGRVHRFIMKDGDGVLNYTGDYGFEFLFYYGDDGIDNPTELSCYDCGEKHTFMRAWTYTAYFTSTVDLEKREWGKGLAYYGNDLERKSDMGDNKIPRAYTKRKWSSGNGTYPWITKTVGKTADGMGYEWSVIVDIPSYTKNLNPHIYTMKDWLGFDGSKISNELASSFANIYKKTEHHVTMSLNGREGDYNISVPVLYADELASYTGGDPVVLVIKPVTDDKDLGEIYASEFEFWTLCDGTTYNRTGHVQEGQYHNFWTYVPEPTEDNIAGTGEVYFNFRFTIDKNDMLDELFEYLDKNPGMKDSSNGYLGGIQAVTNDVELDRDDSIRLHARASVNYQEFFDKALTQSPSAGNNYVARYTITFNEQHLDLNRFGMVTIIDTMYGARMMTPVVTAHYEDGSTANVPYVNSEDGPSDGNQTAFYYRETTNDAQRSEGYFEYEILIFNPTNAKYTVDYGAALVTDGGGIKGYSNSAEVRLGDYKLEAGSNKAKGINVTYMAVLYEISLQKTNSNGDPVPGATYGVSVVQHPSGAEQFINNGMVTDEDGISVFENNRGEGLIFGDHLLYFLQETAAPNGYAVNPARYYFYFCNALEDSVCDLCEADYIETTYASYMKDRITMADIKCIRGDVVVDPKTGLPVLQNGTQQQEFFVHYDVTDGFATELSLAALKDFEVDDDDLADLYAFIENNGTVNPATGEKDILFTFTLSDPRNSTAKLPENTTVTVSLRDLLENGAQAVAFDAIEFSQTGTYLFYIEETVDENLNYPLYETGLHYDGQKIAVEVKVGTDGTIYANMVVESVRYQKADAIDKDATVIDPVAGDSVTLTGDNGTFVNSFDSEEIPVKETLSLSKAMTGRAFETKDAFKFTLTAMESSLTDENGDAVMSPMPELQEGETDEDGVYEVELTSSDINTNTGLMEHTFGEITFVKPGVYQYRLAEVFEGAQYDPDTAVRYDSVAWIATVTVTEGEDGQLVAEVAYRNEVNSDFDDDNARFVNAYLPAGDGRLTIPVEKLKSQALQDAEIKNPELKKKVYTFTLRPGTTTIDGVTVVSPMPLQQNALTAQFRYETINGKEEFVSKGSLDLDVSFTAAGVYPYILREEQSSDAKFDYDGVIYDTTTTVYLAVVTPKSVTELETRWLYKQFDTAEDAAKIDVSGKTLSELTHEGWLAISPDGEGNVLKAGPFTAENDWKQDVHPTLTIPFEKTMEDRYDLPQSYDKDRYYFTIRANFGSPMPEGANVSGVTHLYPYSYVETMVNPNQVEGAWTKETQDGKWSINGLFDAITFDHITPDHLPNGEKQTYKYTIWEGRFNGKDDDKVSNDRVIEDEFQWEVVVEFDRINAASGDNTIYGTVTLKKLRLYEDKNGDIQTEILSTVTSNPFKVEANAAGTDVTDDSKVNLKDAVGTQPGFTNVYDPVDVTLPIHAYKAVAGGHKMPSNQTVTFALTLKDATREDAVWVASGTKYVDDNGKALNPQPAVEKRNMVDVRQWDEEIGEDEQPATANMQSFPKGYTIAKSTTISTTSGYASTDFPTLGFSKPGTYTFTVKEIHTDSKGFTFSNASYTYTVVVKDNPATGELTIAEEDINWTKTDDDNWTKDSDDQEFVDADIVVKSGKPSEEKIEFTNYYRPEPTDIALEVEKTFSTSSPYSVPPTREEPKAFKFTLVDIVRKPLSDEDSSLPPMPDGKTTHDLVDVVYTPNQTVTVYGPSFNKDIYPTSASFGNITFNRAGTYVVTVIETTDAAYPGYDKTLATENGKKFTFNVVVTDKGGYLQVTSNGVTTKNNVPTLTLKAQNTYETKPVLLGLTLTKLFDTENGIKPKKNKSFSFNVSATGTPAKGVEVLKNPLTITTSGDGKTETFADVVKFISEGTYTITITEKSVSNDGYDYDDAVYTIEVEAVDNESLIEITVTKATKTTKLEDGTEVTEDIDVTAEITEEGEKQTKAVLDTTFTFINTYTVKDTTVEFEVEKKVEPDETAKDAGVSVPEKEYSFSFKLEAVTDGAPMPEKTEVTVSYPDDLTAVFGKITYNNTHMGGTYVYKISEIVPDEDEKAASIIYDDTVYTVTVVIDDDGEGQLVATITSVTADDGAEDTLADEEANVTVSFTFTNKYELTGTQVVFDPSVSKTIEGPAHENHSTREFEFTITQISGETVELPAAITVKDGESKKFDSIVFTKVGTYSFTITETSDTLPGFKNDDPKTIVVVVSDNGEGKLVATVTESGDQANAEPSDQIAQDYEFTNTYSQSPAIEALIPVRKIVDGEDVPNGQIETFTFVIEAAEAYDSVTIVNGKVEIKGAGTPEDRFKIEFAEEGTFTFTVKETAGTNSHYTYDETVYTVTVTVEDVKGEGELTATFEYSPDAPEFVFTNTYTPDPTELTLDVTKAFTANSDDRPSDDPKAFTFTLEATVNPENGAALGEKTEVTIGEGKTAAFDAITFTKAGEYTFTIAEKNDGLPGYAYADAQTVTVTVIDEDGQLVAYVNETETKAESLTFENTYTVTPTEYVIPVAKAISGDIPAASRTFTFTLTAEAQDGAKLPETTQITIAGPNAGSMADKTGAFDAIAFTKAGTYTFTVSETAGDIPGYTYDANSWTVTVTVKDIDSKLTVVDALYSYGETATTAKTATFTNAYAYKPTALIIPIEKSITGVGYVNPTFTFTLTADEQDGAELPQTRTQTIIGVGSASFDEIAFTKPGTFVFTVRENRGAEPGFNYDTRVWTVTAVVEDIDSQLTVTELTYARNGEIIADAEAASFVNGYEPEINTETVELSGVKIWVDNGNAAGLRPDAIEVILLADGVRTGRTPVWTETDTDNWTYTFTDLPATTEGGSRITYTVIETAVPYYEGTQDGTTLINTLIPRQEIEYTSVNGTKTWVDNDNANDLRPESITIQLLRNGAVIEERVVTEADGWSYEFTDLPTSNGYGDRYTYTIREIMVSGYYAIVDGYDVTNYEAPTSMLVNIPYDFTTQVPLFGILTAEELEELLDLFDYDVPLFGGLLGTGLEIPAYPFVFAGVGLLALALLVLTRKKREKTA